MEIITRKLLTSGYKQINLTCAKTTQASVSGCHPIAADHLKLRLPGVSINLDPPCDRGESFELLMQIIQAAAPLSDHSY